MDGRNRAFKASLVTEKFMFYYFLEEGPFRFADCSRSTIHGAE